MSAQAGHQGQISDVTADQVLGTMRNLLVDMFDVDADKITADASFDSMDLDSLDLVEVSVKVEDAYDIEISEDDLKDVWTVGNAVEVVLSKLQQTADA